MAKSFEYRICTVINDHVAAVNNEYVAQGKFERIQDSLAGCMPDWQYLQTAGAEGWELVAVAPATTTEWQGTKVKMEYLYLKREIV